MPDSREISSRLSIISESLKERVEMAQVGEENNNGGVPFVALNQALPSRFLRVIGSDQWATHSDNTVLVLRFARISKNLSLRDERYRDKPSLSWFENAFALGSLRGFVIKKRRWCGRSISRARRRCET